MQVAEEVGGVLPEVAMRAMDAEQLGQLCARKEQGDAALEADHDAFGDEVDDGAGAHRPGGKGDHGHQQAVPAASAPKRAESPPEISASEAPTRSEMADVTEIAVPGAAEEPEDEPGEEAGIEPSLRRQVGQRRITEPRRKQVGRERQTGNQVAAQPRGVMVFSHLRAGTTPQIPFAEICIRLRHGMAARLLARSRLLTRRARW